MNASGEDRWYWAAGDLIGAIGAVVCFISIYIAAVASVGWGRRHRVGVDSCLPRGGPVWPSAALSVASHATAHSWRTGHDF